MEGEKNLADNKSSDSNENRVRRRSVSVSDPVINCCVFIIKQCARLPRRRISIGRAVAADARWTVGVGSRQANALRAVNYARGNNVPKLYTTHTRVRVRATVKKIYIFIHMRRGEVYASTTTTVSLLLSCTYSLLEFLSVFILLFVLFCISSLFLIIYLLFFFFFIYIYFYSVSRGLGR